MNKRAVLLSLVAAGLMSGCATPPKPSTKNVVTGPIEQASVWLNESAATASMSLRHLDQITEVHLKNPDVQVTHVSSVSGLTDHLRLHWSGPVNRLMAVLAQHIGWRDAFGIDPHPMPDVAIWDQNAPLPVIIHQINKQMIGVATLRMLPLDRTLALEPYQKSWLPTHPVIMPYHSSDIAPAISRTTPTHMVSPPLMRLNHAGKMEPMERLFTIGKGGSIHPLKQGAHGPNIPLKEALKYHWKLLMPWHPTPSENAIANKWMDAGGILYRP